MLYCDAAANKCNIDLKYKYIEFVCLRGNIKDEG